MTDVDPQAEQDEEGICPQCRGTGKVAGEPCPRCDGTGKLVEGIGGG
ncbi:hypothetical protein [Sphingomonas sp. DBB INV C78]